MIFSIIFTKEDPFVISMTFLLNIRAALIFSIFMLIRTKSSRVERNTICQNNDYKQWQQSRIAVSNLHKETQKKFPDSISILYHMKNPVMGKAVTMISEKHYDIMIKNKDEVGAAVLDDTDFQYQYFGFKTLPWNAPTS